MQSIQLITLYYYVCDKYSEKMQWSCQRFSNNADQGKITDEELITIQLFCLMYQARHSVRSMYDYIQDHWLDWFPDLPSYQAFNHRLNRLTPCFKVLVNDLCEAGSPCADVPWVLLGDSMPIITCAGNRKAKVAPSLTAKGYCATKKLHYFGLKLHMMALKVPQKLPLPKVSIVTPASTHDLRALRTHLESLYGIPVVLDKAYCDTGLEADMAQNQASLLTPVKWKKGMPNVLKQFDKAYVELFNRAVAKIRQPIESLFAWIQQKTNIQKASYVRSEAGLERHVFTRLAAALLLLIGF